LAGSTAAGGEGGSAGTFLTTVLNKRLVPIKEHRKRKEGYIEIIKRRERRYFSYRRRNT
jgi:hypothetical protein